MALNRLRLPDHDHSLSRASFLAISALTGWALGHAIPDSAANDWLIALLVSVAAAVAVAQQTLP